MVSVLLLVQVVALALGPTVQATAVAASAARTVNVLEADAPGATVS